MNKTNKARVRQIKRQARVTGRTALKAFLRLSKFVQKQIRIRPRARVATKTLAVLAIAFAISSQGVAFIKPHEDEIKINGEAVLVAQEKLPEITKSTQEISQSVDYIRSPFLSEKPIDGPVSQGYSGYHRALDITSPVGTQIKPVGPGVVEFAGFMPDGRGNVVIVDHGDGLRTLYAHMGKISSGVGNMVGPDTIIGTVGMTGRTTGPHVHFEVYDRGIQVNPKNLLP